MRRRELLTGLLGATAASAVRAAESSKVYRLAFMSPAFPIKEMNENGSLQGFTCRGSAEVARKQR
jgi:hypothetical protein